MLGNKNCLSIKTVANPFHSNLLLQVLRPERSMHHVDEDGSDLDFSCDAGTQPSVDASHGAALGPLAASLGKHIAFKVVDACPSKAHIDKVDVGKQLSYHDVAITLHKIRHADLAVQTLEVEVCPTRLSSSIDVCLLRNADMTNVYMLVPLGAGLSIDISGTPVGSEQSHLRQVAQQLFDASAFPDSPGVLSAVGVNDDIKKSLRQFGALGFAVNMGPSETSWQLTHLGVQS